MEDSHFLISKGADGGRTLTHIRRLDDEESLRELARLLGGADLTQAALTNAREMKAQAEREKERTGET